MDPAGGPAAGEATQHQAPQSEATDRASGSALFGRGLLYGIVTALQLVTSALVSPILAHLMGDPAEFGRLSSAIALHQMLVVVGVVGLDQAVVLRRGQDGHDRDARSLASAAIMVVTAVTGLLFVTSRWWGEFFGFGEASPVVTVTVLWTLPSAAVMIMMGLLLAGDRLGPYTAVGIATAAGGQIAGIVVVLIAGPSAQDYLLGLVAVDIVATVAAALLTRPQWRRAMSWKVLRPGLTLGAPLMFSALSLFVLNAGDRIVIQRLLGPAEVGRYQIAYTVGFVAAQLIGLIGSAWTPRFAAIKDLPTRWRLIGQSRDALYRVLCPVVLGVVLAAPMLLRIVAPESFQPDSLLIVVFLIVSNAFLIAATGATGRMLITEGRSVPLAVWAGTSAALNVGLNLLLVPIAGIAGASAATVIAYTAQSFGQRWSAGRRDLWPRTPRRLLVMAGVVIAVAAGTVLLPQDLGWNIARVVLGLACLPWLWVEVQRARRS
ncbi:lipopolysaccharide biosynthesis protein [Nakamurella leprariae]|uniref:Lipopolysaccharide biosynthesis protein n=1 Tax=Nakamurella leprariae TaxID=2803911 RepID=A0A938YF71_9ACTN|nr:lipopolysaccharide biosynthesis protein [Nakamurella leprariae]MBM9466730.1 lipopolysaccharide biosynthesis protein [Nakamurella leprariae]